MGHGAPFAHRPRQPGDDPQLRRPALLGAAPLVLSGPPPEGPRPELVVFVGLQASGKTTFYAERFAATHVHVSKDLMRNARRKERRQARLVAEALAAGRSVVVDNTNPTPDERRPLVELGRACGARVVGYYFESTVADSLARNEAREGRARVPLVGVYATAKRLELPSLAEGFDALFRVRIAPGGGFAVGPWR